MTQENKNLLLKDLCARLPYKPICFKKITNCISGDSVLLEEDIYSFRTGKPTVADYGQYDYYKTVVLEIKPYLRPMSSMTEDECITLSKLIPYETDAWKYIKTPIPLYIVNTEQFDFFHSHHLDWRGLISKGLAIEVTEDDNPYKE